MENNFIFSEPDLKFFYTLRFFWIDPTKIILYFKINFILLPDLKNCLWGSPYLKKNVYTWDSPYVLEGRTILYFNLNPNKNLWGSSYFSDLNNCNLRFVPFFLIHTLLSNPTVWRKVIFLPSRLDITFFDQSSEDVQEHFFLNQLDIMIFWLFQKKYISFKTLQTTTGVEERYYNIIMWANI